MKRLMCTAFRTCSRWCLLSTSPIQTTQSILTEWRLADVVRDRRLTTHGHHLFKNC
jgi:hypothetical protein